MLWIDFVLVFNTKLNYFIFYFLFFLKTLFFGGTSRNPSNTPKIPNQMNIFLRVGRGVVLKKLAPSWCLNLKSLEIQWFLFLLFNSVDPGTKTPSLIDRSLVLYVDWVSSPNLITWVFPQKVFFPTCFILILFVIGAYKNYRKSNNLLCSFHVIFRIGPCTLVKKTVNFVD